MIGSAWYGLGREAMGQLRRNEEPGRKCIWPMGAEPCPASAVLCLWGALMCGLPAFAKARAGFGGLRYAKEELT